MERIGRNHDGYHGETIDIQTVLRDGVVAAEKFGWLVASLPASDSVRLLAFHRGANPAVKRVYISTGIHGDEPAGPLAVAQLLRENQWPVASELWLCPCLNPTGFPLNRRENAQGQDLNRDYRHPATDEIRAHIAWLQRLPNFDLTLCLHEDWEAHGFYLYELNPDAQPSVAEHVIEAAGTICPIDPSPVIEGRDAVHGIIRPNLHPDSRPDWPEAFFLIQNKTRLSYTLEAPSDFPLSIRVAALVRAVRMALDRG